MYNVYAARTQERLFEAIWVRKCDENYLDGYKYTLTEIIQGYYFFQYQDKQIDLRELLLKSGDVQDADPGDGTVDCEFFYYLCNDLEADPKLAVSEEFTKIIYEYFVPRYEEAMKQKKELESATLEDLVL